MKVARGFSVLFAIAVCLMGSERARAQLVAPQNAAQRVAAAYRYEQNLPGYHFEGVDASADPRTGVAVSYTSTGKDGLRFDVFLYQAPHARLDGVGVREAFAAYSTELTEFYLHPGYAIEQPLAEPRTFEWKIGDTRWPGVAHLADVIAHDVRLHTYALLFYSRGHLIKLRASVPVQTLREGKLRKHADAFMRVFLAGFAVEQPFGHHCGMPTLVEVPADDPRVGTFAANDHSYFIATGLSRERIADELATVTQASIVRSSSAGCFGDGVKIEMNGGKSQ